ncbi:MAG TPA: NADH-quinone oxidoreductase subunit C [Mycobacteriales bacterium]|nr:NADH-quinone oxidoreductase subunit C [Mycobacteriales bacterium]
MTVIPVAGVDTLRDDLVARLARGERFAGLLASAGDGAGQRLRLTALSARPGALDPLDAYLPADAAGYPALTPDVPAAAWYERALHDLFGVTPLGHPDLDPLVLPRRDDGTALPRPGSGARPGPLEPDERASARRVTGAGLFTIPHGPVRSGVLESIEYLVETPGEDVLHLRVRPFAKHRGVQNRFEGMTAADGVLLAERVEGIASVAHALAFSHAVESMAGVVPPRPAAMVRVLHAELERVANHLDVTMKLADAAGLAVAVARFGWHKEGVLRLVGDLCGSRFGRGVVVPGGVRGLPRLGGGDLLRRLDRLDAAIAVDARALMDTASFLDRLRGTGVLDPALALRHGALGPVGRGSGCAEDVRWSRPYDHYPRPERPTVPVGETGDALARLRVRLEEVADSFDLARRATDLLDAADPDDRTGLAVRMPTPAGRGLGWAEAPQGEVVYLLDVGADGRITRCAPRSASFHNLALFPATFNGDVLTDFPFIEASFGLSVAGAVM